MATYRFTNLQPALVSVANNDWTEIGDVGIQDYVVKIENVSAVVVQIAYKGEKPTGTVGDTFNPDDKETWDHDSIPIGKVWAFQNSGGPVNVKFGKGG